MWVWEYPLEDGQHHDMFMDPGEQIRIRVIQQTFKGLLVSFVQLCFFSPRSALTPEIIVFIELYNLHKSYQDFLSSALSVF